MVASQSSRHAVHKLKKEKEGFIRVEAWIKKENKEKFRKLVGKLK